MELLLKIVGPDNVMFASEMLGGVTTIDPQTGRFFDDNKPCLDAVVWLTESDRRKIQEENVVKVYPRLRPILARRAEGATRGVARRAESALGGPAGRSPRSMFDRLQGTPLKSDSCTRGG